MTADQPSLCLDTGPHLEPLFPRRRRHQGNRWRKDRTGSRLIMEFAGPQLAKTSASGGPAVIYLGTPGPHLGIVKVPLSTEVLAGTFTAMGSCCSESASIDAPLRVNGISQLPLWDQRVFAIGMRALRLADRFMQSMDNCSCCDMAILAMSWPLRSCIYES